jgi:hypothetical protein
MLLYVDEVYDLFRRYVDESKKTFMTDAAAQQYLSIAYDEFRKMVTQYDPMFYAVSQTYNPGGAYQLDLTATVPAIMGSTAGANRLSKLISVSQPDPVTAEPMYFYLPMNAPGNSPDAYNSGYYLRGTVLHFTGPVSTSVRLDYVPVQSVDWTKITTTPPRQFIDELVEYHDLIALIACRQYFIIDGMESNEISKQIQSKLTDLRDYLASGRDMQARTRMIHNVDYTSGWNGI